MKIRYLSHRIFNLTREPDSTGVLCLVTGVHVTADNSVIDTSLRYMISTENGSAISTIRCNELVPGEEHRFEQVDERFIEVRKIEDYLTKSDAGYFLNLYVKASERTKQFYS